MIKVGLTGNRFSGLDKVSNLFRRISIPVFEADVVLRFIIYHNKEINQEIIKRLSDLNRTVGFYVLPSYAKSLDEINIVLDCTKKELLKAFDKFCEKNKKSQYVIFKSYILFEADFYEKMDYNINIFIPKASRMEKCRKLTQFKITDIAVLFKNELDELEKNRCSNFVIKAYNLDKSSLFNDLKVNQQVNEIDKFIVDKYLELS